MTYEPLWTEAEIAAATSGTSTGRWSVEGIAIDSRDIVPGDLFIALHGQSSNGHDHVADALKAGAVAAIVSCDCPGLERDDPRLMRVCDTYSALLALARVARDRMTGVVAAVTGSAGKTSVKEALRLALGRSERVHASIRSFNNHVGVPLSLARMPRETSCAVFELGMNKAGEIAPLSRLVRPDVAVITSVGPAHMAAFKDVDAIADAKAEIFEGLAPDGTAILNVDHAWAKRLLKHAQKANAATIQVSVHDKDADVCPMRLVMAQDKSCMTARLGETLVTCKVGSAGQHWVMNALLVLATVKAMEADIGMAALALAEMRAPAGRGLRHKITTRDGDFTLIDDAYNANPLSMAAALATLSRGSANKTGRRLAILADMAELGERTRDLHLGLVPDMKSADFTSVIALGSHMTALADAAGVSCHAVESVQEAIRLLNQMVRPGDVVLVKGSHGANLRDLIANYARHGGQRPGLDMPKSGSVQQEEMQCYTTS